LGNHRRQSQQSRLELGLRLKALTPTGETIWIADAHRGDETLSVAAMRGNHFIVHLTQASSLFFCSS
jgi:hypothetical protein